MAPDSHLNFRLRGIPHNYQRKSDVRNLVTNALSISSRANFTVHSLAINPVDSNSRVATLSFLIIPPLLTESSKKEWIIPLPMAETADEESHSLRKPLVFDTHFGGFTPLQLTDEDDCHVDLIALSGLGGHAFGSFKERDGPFMWLRDALPLDIPAARILIYGYDTQMVQSSSFQSLANLGRSFQIHIRTIRKLNRSRPLIFIGHSLGGLLIKDVVVKLKEDGDEQDLATLKSTSAFLFFGVPHEGMATESLVPLVQDQPNRALLESLGKNSDLLSNLQRNFQKAFGSKPPKIVSYFETEKSRTARKRGDKWELSGHLDILVDPASAICGSKDQHPINRSHSEIVKYTSYYDEAYTRVQVMLDSLVSGAGSMADSRNHSDGYDAPPFLTDQQEDCIRSLNFPERDHRCNEIRFDQGTCEWLRNDAGFQGWTSKPQGLFWIEGNPGSGKSCLMKYAFENLKKRNSGEIIASFFFHGRGVPLQKTPLGLFRALLGSLLVHFPGSLSHLLLNFQHRERSFGSCMQNRWQWTESELQDSMTQLLTQETKEKSVVILIDALDECGDDEARQLLAYLRDVMEKAAQAGGRLKVCISSRHYPVLGVHTFPGVIVEDKNDKDIRQVVQKHSKNIQPESERREFEKKILMRVRGGFQWAVLVVAMVIEENTMGMNRERILDKIQTTPQALEQLYTDILGCMNDSEKRQATKLFLWILFAERPLSVQELRDALAADKDMELTTVAELRNHQDWSDSVERFEIRVRHLSRGLIEFQTRDMWEQYEPDREEFNREAQFIHQSVPDFLIKHYINCGQVDPQISISPAGLGHLEISRSCLKYLALREVLDGANLPRGSLSAKYPLAPYAVRFFFHHIHQLDKEGVTQFDLLDILHWAPQSEFLHKVAALWKALDPDSAHCPMGWPFSGATVLHVLVALGAKTTFTEYLKNEDIEVGTQDLDGNTPLLLAIREGHHDMALMLLSLGQEDRDNRGLLDQKLSLVDDESEDEGPWTRTSVNVNAENNDGDTAMTVAFTERADSLILALIECGAELQAFGPQRELMFYAIRNKNVLLVKKLIQKQLDLEGAIYSTVRGVYSMEENQIRLEILSQLLQAGAPMNKPSELMDLEEYSETGSDDELCDQPDSNPADDPIHIASRTGQAAIVRLLLQHGANPHVPNRDGDRPFLLALKSAHEEVIEALLENDPTVVDRVVRTLDRGFLQVLDDLFGTNQHSLIMLLVTKGRFSARKGVLEELLRKAASSGDYTIVNAVIDKDPRITNFGYFSRSRVLQTCISTGAEKMALHLLDRGCHVPGFILSDAAENGMTSLAKSILMKDKSLVDDFNFHGMTALMHAIRNGDEGFAVSLVTKWDASVNATDYRGRTPLMLAIERGLTECLNLVLTKDVLSISFTDMGGMSALTYALEKTDEEICLRLVKTSSSAVTGVDSKRRSALEMSAILGFSDTLRIIFQDRGYPVSGLDNRSVMRLAYSNIMGFPTIECALQDQDAGEFLQKITDLAPISGDVGPDSKTVPCRVDDSGMTALMHAVRSGYKTLTGVLINKWTAHSLNMMDSSGKTALAHAVLSGNADIVRILIREGGEFLSRDSLDQAQSYAHELKRYDLLQILLPEDLELINPFNFISALLKTKNSKVDYPTHCPAWLFEEIIATNTTPNPWRDLQHTIIKDYKRFPPIVTAVAILGESMVQRLVDTGKVGVESLREAALLADRLGLEKITNILEVAING